MILIDFSGTIVDFFTLAKRGFQEANIPWYRNKGYTDSIKKLKAAHEIVNKRLKKTKYEKSKFAIEVGKVIGLKFSKEDGIDEWKTFHKFCVHNAELLENVEKGLQELNKIDDLAIFTNGDSDFILPILEKFKLIKYFKQFICLGRSGKHKTKGDGFKELEKQGAWAIVGDTPNSDGKGEEFNIKFLDVKKGWPWVVIEARKVYYSRK